MIQLALMTSFSTFGIFRPNTKALLNSFDEAYRKLLHTPDSPPDQQLPVELYVAMEPDLKEMGRLTAQESSEMSRPNSALATLGNVRFSDDVLTTLAQQLSDAVQVHPTKKRPIVALASFLPEISSTDAVGPETNAPARLALENLLRLGAQLRQIGHPVHVVEAVCGSLIEQLSPVVADTGSQSEATWEVALDEHRAVFKRLLDSLKAVWGKLEAEPRTFRASLRPPSYPPVALELEPGLCFALRGERSLKLLTELLDSPYYSTLRTKVGFNLDMAHFAIAGVKPETVRNLTSLRDRILHVHASGFHPKAHFGDCVPSDENLEALGPWFEFVRDLDSSTGRQLRSAESAPFSGCVSIELEATGTSADVEKCISLFGEKIQSLNRARN